MTTLRHALRALRSNPIVSAAALVSLSLAIGATTAVLMAVDALLLRPLPVADPGRLVTISSDFALGYGFTAGHGWSYPMWLRLEQRNDMFAGALAWLPAPIDLASRGEKQTADGLFVSGSYFTALGLQPAIGRLLAPADDVRGGGADGAVAVISDAFWKQKYARDPAVLGTPIVLGGVPFTIVGVTSKGFFGTEVGRRFDVALPLATEPLARPGRSQVESRRSFTLTVMLRLKADQTIDAATAQLRAVHADLLGVSAEGLAHVSPAFLREPFVLVPAATGTADRSALRREFGRAFLTLFAVVVFVLLVACVNIANLSIARAAAGAHELSLRSALGASRLRLARQVFVDSLVLAVLGAAGGLLVAAWAGRALGAYLSGSSAQAFLAMSFTWRVLAFTAAIAGVTAVVSALLPAARVMRTAPIAVIRGQSSGSSSTARPALLSGLVVLQVAVSMVIVTATGLFVRTLDRLLREPLGFDGGSVLVARVDASRVSIDPAARDVFVQSLLSAVSSVPGVARTSVSRLTPLSEASNSPLLSQPDRVPENAVMPGWFATWGTAIRSGRDFQEADAAANVPVAVVNEAYVRRFLPDRQALGATVEGRTIIGVVQNTVFGSIRGGMRPILYVPFPRGAGWDRPSGATIDLSVRSAGVDPIALSRSVAAALSRVHPDITFTLRPVKRDIEASVARERIVAMLSIVLATLALLLAALGLYGLTAYSVHQRRDEFGIRLAVGSTPREILRMVLTRVAVLVAAGVIAGAGASVWLTAFLSTMLHGVEARDPLSLLVAAVLLTTAGLAAGLLPARRASGVDPAALLRTS